jgi:molybdopterin molybdotransferase
MIGVSEAQALVLQHACPLPPEAMPLTHEALGLVLAEDAVSDLAMPPFDKAMMDGYAVRSVDLPEGRGILTVIEEIAAGKTPERTIQEGQAARIMTGAPIPEGADAVVMIECTKSLEANRVQIEDRPPKPGQNILYQGREMRPGEIVLRAGTELRPQEFGLLSALGRTAVQVHPAPRVAILATGDELVPASQMPGPGRIRNTNGPMLVGQVCRAGGVPLDLGISYDDIASLRSLVGTGLRAAHVLVLSGGVSAGKLDLVPGVLKELEVEAHFHKVEMKPGKPVFFGSRGSKLVFGLPGNPVSVLACFELFVRPALRRLGNHKDAGPKMVQATLLEDFPYRTDRPTYHPAWLDDGPNGWRVRIVPWFGSPDLRALSQANALAVLPKGDHQHRSGQVLSVLKMEE